MRGKKMPSYKIGTEGKDDLRFRKENEFKLGSGQYNPNYGLTKSSTSKWGFGTGKRPNLTNGGGGKDVPSPNTYELK
jgi:hypothetical protein